jgi:hypothetical protein
MGFLNPDSTGDEVTIVVDEDERLYRNLSFDVKRGSFRATMNDSVNRIRGVPKKDLPRNGAVKFETYTKFDRFGLINRIGLNPSSILPVELSSSSGEGLVVYRAITRIGDWTHPWDYHAGIPKVRYSHHTNVSKHDYQTRLRGVGMLHSRASLPRQRNSDEVYAAFGRELDYTDYGLPFLNRGGAWSAPYNMVERWTSGHHPMVTISPRVAYEYRMPGDLRRFLDTPSLRYITVKRYARYLLPAGKTSIRRSLGWRNPWAVETAQYDRGKSLPIPIKERVGDYLILAKTVNEICAESVRTELYEWRLSRVREHRGKRRFRKIFILPGTGTYRDVRDDISSKRAATILKSFSPFQVGSEAHRQLKDCWDECQVKLQEKATHPNVLAPVGLIELGKLRKEFPVLLRRLSGVVHNIVRPKGFAEFGLRLADATTDLTLNVNYGIRPLISDLIGLVKTYNEVVEKRGAYTFKKGGKTSERTLTLPVEIPGTDILAEYFHVLDVKYGAVFRQGELPPLIHIGKQIGLFELAKNGWELIPFSFVVDWLFRVSSVLSAFSYNPKLDVHYSYGTMRFSSQLYPVGRRRKSTAWNTLGKGDRERFLNEVYWKLRYPGGSSNPQHLTEWIAQSKKLRGESHSRVQGNLKRAAFQTVDYMGKAEPYGFAIHKSWQRRMGVVTLNDLILPDITNPWVGGTRAMNQVSLLWKLVSR